MTKVGVVVGVACLLGGWAGAACGGSDAEARDAPPVRPAPPLEPVRLDGTWHLLGITHGPPVPAEAVPTLTLSEGLRMRGDTGCNTVASPLVVDSVGVRFERLAVSGAACPDEATRAIERAWVEVLRGTRRVGRYGDNLLLVGVGNAELARMGPGPPPDR